MENELLNQLNSELQAKNNLLNVVLNNSWANMNSTAFYASLTRSNVKKGEKDLNIIVKTKNNNNTNVAKKVKNQIISDQLITISNVKENKNGYVAVKCKNNEAVNRAKIVLSEKLCSDFCVELEQLNLSRIKVANVYYDLMKDQHFDDIYNHYFLEHDSVFTIIADSKYKMDKCTLILEITAESY